MKTIAKWALLLFYLFLASLARAQPIIQTNSTFGWVTLHNFSSPTVITLGQSGLIYGILESSPPALYEMSTNGDLLWITPLTNAAVGTLTNIQQGADGNLYLHGSAAIVSASTNGAINWILPPTNNGVINFLSCGADSNLYGACVSGGTNSMGQVVAIEPGGSYLWTFSFDRITYETQPNGPPYGSAPNGPPLEASDGNLYGPTLSPLDITNGVHFNGGLYSLTRNGNFRWNFYPTNRGHPFGAMIQGFDGSLYCQTQAGVMSFSTDGLMNWFSSYSGSYDSEGVLLQGSDGNLYAGATRLVSFTTNGVRRWGFGSADSLMLQRKDGFLYGFTAAGNGIFCLSPEGKTYIAQATIHPLSLVQDRSGNIYGSAGSNYMVGQVFELTAGPQIVSQPGDQIYTNRFFNVTNTVNYIGAPPLSFQWQKDGTNLADGSNFGGTVRGSLTNQLTLQNVRLNAAGLYRLVVSNGFGVATTRSFYVSATNRFPTLVSNGFFSIPNPNSFSNYESFGPTALAASVDGSLYLAIQDGERLAQAQTNGAMRWLPTGGFYIASLLQGLNGDVFYNDNGALGAILTNGQPLGYASQRLDSVSEVVMGPGGTLYWIDSQFIDACAESGFPTLLWSWTNSFGDFPNCLAPGRDGSLYVTSVTRTDPVGRVFSLSSSRDVLWNFSFDGTNGFNPQDIIQGVDGNLYGSTQGINLQGSNPTGSDVYGSLFSLSTNGSLRWTRHFGAANGSASLIQGSDGYIYGTTPFGGAYNLGTIFRIAPGGVDYTVIHEFTGGADGANPPCELVQLSDGSYYGITERGGIKGAGVLFRLDLPPAPGAAVFRTATITNSTLSMTFAAIPNRTYQLQYSTDLLTWTNLNAPITASQSLLTIQDPITAGPQRFYRLVRL